ncbi:endoglucanase IV precursor [Pyrenochaeta sp. DS3sAY3a]|nr:endoglucanase IV precursor [Pyrenochaeta sp. DS3sAY3a]
MPSKIQVATLLGALATSVKAHGHLSAINVDGTPFTAYDPSFQFQNPPPEVIEWSCPECLDNGFVSPDMYTDVTKIACHKDATAGAKVATVKAGGSIDIQWNTWPDSHVGPVIDYLAKVDDATSATAGQLNFFKIDEAGFDNGEWAATKLIKNNLTWSVTVPSNIAAGQYVLRHEIIALHSAGQENGAQNYPKCINIEGTETPAGETADKLYTPTDPGIQVNIYSGDLSGYKIPGPALFSGSASSSGSGSSPAAPAASSPATSAAAATSSAAVQNNAVSSSVAAVPTATNVSASPSAPAETGSAGLPKEFTIDTFITWLQEEAGSSLSAKARRHARAFRG